MSESLFDLINLFMMTDLNGFSIYDSGAITRCNVVNPFNGGERYVRDNISYEKLYLANNQTPYLILKKDRHKI
ncbi:MAG: hypothetical protein CM1200mP3_15540 [Chloroflexota bacterium]|nr:MAG: hypothetical protein CM1200mP3_15540 [Chloroflexota bacterium]